MSEAKRARTSTVVHTELGEVNVVEELGCLGRPDEAEGLVVRSAQIQDMNHRLRWKEKYAYIFRFLQMIPLT
jgi:hypothetical protein